MIRKIKKRDGKIVDFNPVRITEAIWKAAQAVGGKDYKRAAELTDKVLDILEKELSPGRRRKNPHRRRTCQDSKSIHPLQKTTPGYARDRRLAQRHRCGR
jgi:hypothetical protein